MATPTPGQNELSSSYGAEMASINQRLVQIRYESRFFLKSGPNYTFADTCLGVADLSGQEYRSDFSMCQRRVNLAT